MSRMTVLWTWEVLSLVACFGAYQHYETTLIAAGGQHFRMTCADDQTLVHSAGMHAYYCLAFGQKDFMNWDFNLVCACVLNLIAIHFVVWLTRYVEKLEREL